MIPDQTLSSQLIYAAYISPDELAESDLLSYELGGIALSDATQGLQVQTWTLRGVPTGGVSDPVDMIVSAPNTPDTTLLSLVGVTEISLAFDQNMKPAIAYIQNGSAHLWWYDATIPGYTTVDFPSGVKNPRASLDDKRPLNLGVSDIIVAYIRDDNLYFRAQSDRFTVEYILQADLSSQIIAPQLYKIGMNKEERFMFYLRGALFA